MTKLWIFSLLTFLLAILPIPNAAICPGGCGSFGTCTGSSCICSTGYFNSGNGVSSCVQTAIAIREGTYDEYDFDNDASWKFFYISLEGIETYVQIDFKLDQGELDAYYILQESDEFDVPTPSNKDGTFTIFSLGGTMSKVFSTSQISDTNEGWLVLAIRNMDTGDSELDIRYSTGDVKTSGLNVRNMIIGIAVAAGVIFIVALCVYRRVKLRRMRYANRQRAANRRRRASSEDIEAAPRPQHEAQNNNHEHPPVDPNRNYAPVINPNQAHLLANQNNRPAAPQLNHHHHHHGQRPPGQNQAPQIPQAQQAQNQAQNQARPLAPASNILTKEEIQKYFPKKPFKELETPFPQTTCSICIDEFRPEVVCHQLYCHHIFHGPCIEAWLAKHDSCPDCRKPITRKAIREFLKAEKKRKDEELRSANKVKVMKESVRASKSVHKSQTLQRRDSDHQVHQPQQ